MHLDLTNPFHRRPTWLAQLPRIVRLYILNAALGFVLSGIFTAAIIWLNVANIGHLVAHVSGGWLAALVFFVLNGLVFAGVQSAIVIMGIDASHTDGGPSHRTPNAPPHRP